jgi:hypothetical protein
MRELLAFCLVGGIAYAAIMTVCFHHDVIAGFALRPLHRRCFSLAWWIARSLREEPDLWIYDRGQTTHGPTGIIIHGYGGDALGLTIETRVGNWKPGAVSRRIIRDALDDRTQRLLRDLAPHYFNPATRANNLRLANQSGLPLVEGSGRAR